MTKSSQFRIPLPTKNLFRDICNYRDVSMSKIVIQCLEQYIAEQTKDPALMRHLRNQQTTKATGLVQDNRNTWVKPETLIKEDDWRRFL